MKDKIQNVYDLQNIITQSQYNIDKSRKELDENKEKFKELVREVINRAEIRLKEKRRKKHRKIFYALLWFVGCLIVFVVGIVLKIPV